MGLILFAFQFMFFPTQTGLAMIWIVNLPYGTAL